VGDKAKDDPSQDFSTVNGTRIGHEALNPASYVIVVIIIIIIIIIIINL